MQAPFVINPRLDFYYLSERAVTIEFGHKIDEGLLETLTDFNQYINHNPFPGFDTSIQAYTTITVFFDPLQVIQSKELPGNDCFEKVCNYILLTKEKKKTVDATNADIITIPVCYGGDLGPDIEEVANTNNLTIEEVIRLHSDAVYRVFMIGFIPGFAYLGGMNEKLSTPRKSAPRQQVPAGAVGIAGKQTGIYPLKTPGGWQIIGQSPIKLFDARRPKPSLLTAGDRVSFKPIDRSGFDLLMSE